jgi:FOG: Ankyrin repeat
MDIKELQKKSFGRGVVVAIRIRSSVGETPLLLAAKQCQLSMARWLLEYCGMDPNCQDIYGRTPLFWACTQGNEDMVNLLLEQPWIQPDLPDKAYARSESQKFYGRTLFAHAVINGHGKIVE